MRKEYLRDLQDGHEEFVEGVWVLAKSIPGRAFYFETYLPEYGALYDKLPISAFVSSPKTPKPDLDLPNLQFWNCMDYGVRRLGDTDEYFWKTPEEKQNNSVFRVGFMPWNAFRWVSTSY